MSHLLEYLKYYSSRRDPNPGYAVLVTGEWGVGKTYQVHQALASLSQDPFVYISLFGIANSSEIYTEAFAKGYPSESKIKKIIKEIGNITSSLGGGDTAKAISEKLAEHTMKERPNVDLIHVFDDLERAKISASEILGVINRFVEHHGCRAIVIAHEDKLLEDFNSKKEKIFGQTIRVEPAFDDAFRAFSISHADATDCFENFGPSILELFKKSGCKSLRILRHLVEDVTRLWKSLTPEYHLNQEGMLTAISLFSALSIEIRSGNLTRIHLNDRVKTYVSENYLNRKNSASGNGDSVAIGALTEASRRYGSLDLTDQILNNDVIAKMLLDGVYDGDSIRSSLDQDWRFARQDTLPPWRRAMEFESLDHAEARQAFQALARHFRDRKATLHGEISHVFALMFLIDEHRLLGNSKGKDVVVSECKSYVDDVVKERTLETSNEEDFLFEFRHRSFGGFGFWVEESYQREFNEVLEHLEAGCEKVADWHLRESVTPHLKKLILSDLSKFWELISHRNGKAGKFAYKPVLRYIDPAWFIQIVLKNPANLQEMRRAFESRYINLSIQSVHIAERDWALDVLNIIKIEIQKSKGIRKLRLQRSIPKAWRTLEVQTDKEKTY